MNLLLEIKLKPISFDKPVKLVAATWIPLILIFFLPNLWWILIIKFLLIIWILLTIKGSFSDTWSGYETMGAFVSMETAWMGLFLWLGVYSIFIRLICICIILFQFWIMYDKIKKSNNSLNNKKTNRPSTLPPFGSKEFEEEWKKIDPEDKGFKIISVEDEHGNIQDVRPQKSKK